MNVDASDATRTVLTEVKGLFEPLTIRGTTLPNRIVMAPMTRNFSPGGVPGDDVAAYYARRARGGTGLIVTEGVGVDHPAALGEASFGEVAVPVLHGAAPLAGWKVLVDAVHAAGGRVFPQLWHMGVFRSEGTGPHPEARSVSPSGRWGPRDRKATVGEDYLAARGGPVDVATEAIIQDVIAAFARSAANARSVGVDGIAIHAAHGYLIDSFLWPETNRRTDSFGGALATRSRFGVEVVKAIRAAVGADMPIMFRFSQWKQQDVHARIAETPAELERVLGPLGDAGVDIFDASTRFFDTPAFAGSPVNLAGWARKVTGKLSSTVGGVGLNQGMYDTRETGGAASNNLDRVMARFDRGEFDLLGVGRALIADPNWAEKARRGAPFLALTPESLARLT